MADVMASAFHPLILTKLPGVTAPFVALELRAILRDFCAKTRIWKLPMTTMESVVDQSAYALATARNDVEVVMIESAFYDGERLDPKSPDELAGLYGRQDYLTLSGTPEWFYMNEDGDSIVLVRRPDAAGLDITGTVSVRPSITATSYPEFLHTKYGEAIADGTIGRLKALPGLPWTDPKGADVFTGKYIDARGEVKAAVWRGNVRARPRVKARYI